MKNLIFIISFVFFGCSTLGFGDFDNSKQQKINSLNKSAVNFVYQPLIGGKHEVYLAGDFNNWSESATPMKEKNGVYEVTLYLKNGEYAYKFIIDGQWIADENSEEFVDDGYGGRNSLLFVGDKTEISSLRKVEFKYMPESILKEVYIVGSMNDWNQKANRMIEEEKGVFSTTLLLKSGEYEYKFLENGINWVTDKNANNFKDDGFGGKNSIINVDDRFKTLIIKKGDGVFLEHGISTSQTLETVNPLSPSIIEFKTKAHKDDIERIYLIKNGESVLMDKISHDDTYEYYQKIIYLKNKDEKFNYYFIYEDGKEKIYLLKDEFSEINDNSKYFYFSNESVKPFFTPDWVKNGIIYQIFPDRFYNGDLGNDPDFSEWYYDGLNVPPKNGQLLKKYTEYYHFESNWYDHSGLRKSKYHAPDNEGYQPDYNSFYGGDIEGISQKLDYLQDLGVTIIYFNPLFEAKSNHKYDAVDYMKIDPHFGTNEDFKNLVNDAHDRGIKIIIDCAFNHTGETFWAFQDGLKNGPESQYYDWYEWKKWPLPDLKAISSMKTSTFSASDYYACWWGFGHMPDLNYDLVQPNPAENSIKDIKLASPNWEVVNYILDVAEFWISDMDIDGFRLDVPNEVPFWFWKLFREKVKSIKPDAYLVGELWSNAVDWVNDDYFDAVMNYAYFKDPVMRFFNERSCSAKDFDRDLKPGRFSYPIQSTQVMMNLLDSHDTFRYLESCNGDVSRLELAVLFQMSYVGTPHIWYGNEIGMMGGHDPDCRRPFNWDYTKDKKKISLFNYYKKLIEIRNQHSSLRTGSFETLLADGMVYAFNRTDQNSSITILINNDTKSHKIQIPFKNGILLDLLTDKEYLVKNNVLDIDILSMSGMMLKQL